MDDLGFNKVAAAVLATALGFLGVRTLADAVVPDPEFQATYVPEVDLGGGEADEEIVIGWNHPDFIASMDVAEGEKVFKKCQSCHNAERGGANGTGPNLWNVMGKQMGTHPGFGYSSAMQAKAAPWTWEEMDGFLTKPSAWISGTNMNYIGLKKFEQRAAVMAYLNAQSDNPLPLPEAVLPDVIVEPGDLPETTPTAEDLDGDNIALVQDAPAGDAIPEETEFEDVAVVVEAEDDDDPTEVSEEDFQSAGGLMPEDVDATVAEAIDNDALETEVEVEDGPMDSDAVMEFLNRNRAE